MYKITTPNKIVFTEDLRFVKYNSHSNSYVYCNELDAEGIAAAGDVYSLEDKPPLIITVVHQIDDNRYIENVAPAPIAKIEECQSTHINLALAEIADTMFK